MTPFHSPGLTVALALAAGLIAQGIATHLAIPGIVLLLATGVALGPDGLGVVQPDALGGALGTLVGFAVAVILFDGAMGLNVRSLRRQQGAIRQLITVGALVSAIGGLLAARYIMGWPWRVAAIFGALVMVTGPTVINPLLRRLKIERNVGTVLAAEGILVDALGAVAAAVALELAISPTGPSMLWGLGHVATRLGVGATMGAVAGAGLVGLLRLRKVVPEGMENVFVLAYVLALFQGANALQSESGIVAVVAAGLLVGNVETYVQRHLLEFKEQLTTLFIGMLFVLLAADVRLHSVQALGWPGVVLVVVLMLVVRPISVLAGTWRTELNGRQRLLIAWMGPRGIVAAAVASLFAVELEQHGQPGETLRATMFLVIATTVVTVGLTSGWVAGLLRLRRPQDHGWVILGTNDLACAMGLALQEAGEPVLCVDSNPAACRRAEERGLKVLYGNGVEERTLQRAEIDTRAGALGMTRNEEVNLLFVQKAKQEGRLGRLLVTLGTGDQGGVTRAMVHRLGAEVLGGRNIDVDTWSARLRRNIAAVETWVLHEPPGGAQGTLQGLLSDAQTEGHLVPLLVQHGKALQPVGDRTVLRRGDRVLLLVNRERGEALTTWLEQRGWRPVVKAAVDQGLVG